MQIVLKISSDFSNYTAQIIAPRDLSFSEELRGAGELRFTLPLNDPQLPAITELQKIELYAIENGSDLLLWSGVILEIECDFNFAKIFCWNEKKFLERKIIYTAKNWSSKTLTEIKC